jgi:hypothetical protein
MNAKVIQSLLLARLDHPHGRPADMLCGYGDVATKKLRREIHEAGHAVACAEWLVKSFSGMQKGEEFWITNCDLRKEPRNIDLVVAWAGPCAEQLFRVEAPTDIGLDCDFEDSLKRLRADHVPESEWRSELQRAIAKAAEIVEHRDDCVFALALEFAEVKSLSASQCHAIIQRTMRERYPPTMAERREQQAARKGAFQKPTSPAVARRRPAFAVGLLRGLPTSRRIC